MNIDKQTFSLVKLTKPQATDIAKLHIEGIRTGFISSLGVKFVRILYEAISEDKNSFGFTAIEDGEVIGFVAFSCNLSTLYKYVMLKKSWKFFFILVRKIFSLQIIKNIWSNIFYPNKMKKMSLPAAELLSIVVSPKERGRGIANRLVEAGFEECKKRNINKAKVLVRPENIAANKLYQNCGFKFFKTINSHGFVSNIYIVEI